MLRKKLFRTMKLYRAQFISMMIMIALGVGIFVGFNMEWVSIEENTTSFFKATGFADYRMMNEAGFSKEDAQAVADISGVSAVSRFLSVNTSVDGTDGNSLALTVTENEAVSGVLVVEGDAYDSASADGIWLSEKYASANGIAPGDSLTVNYRGLRITGTVRGLVRAGEYLICVRDETQLMPDYKTHGFAYITPTLYEATLGGAGFYPQLNVISDLSKKDFIDACDTALGKTYMVLTKDENSSWVGASGEAEEGQTMGSVLPVLFLLIAVLTMVTTMHRLTVKEKTQIGILKALGFKNRRILFHYTSYALMIGLIGSAIGIALGYGIAWSIMNPSGTMGTYMDMPDWKLYIPWFCWVVIGGILVVLTVIGWLSVRQMLRGSAADSLRPYTPKKMKPLLIERSRLFHKLPFGTRWNLRDVIRHKARTAMSLIGIIGCTVLVVGSLGMRDTMAAFLDTYYEKAIRYTSRVTFTEDATDEARQALIDRYDGDWSASVAVQVEEKTVSMDIYGITHDSVRFPDLKDNFPALPSDGAFLCKRLAKEFGVSAGDTLTVTLYGTDAHYTLRVAGIVRSISESVILSHDYAESLGIAHTPDSVYTTAAPTDIAADSAIKTIQAKQAIVDSFDSFTALMDMMVAILVVAALVLGIVVLYNLGVMSYTERYREMATLKVVGFRDRKIGLLLIGQNLWTTLVGIVVGLPLGYLTLRYLCEALASEYEMRVAISPLTFLIAFALTLGVSMLVSLAVSRKNRKIDMVEALKAGE